MEENTTLLNAGDELVLIPTYTDSVGDHNPNVLTVDWGDGSKSIFAGAGNPPEGIEHTYTGPGTYQPSLSLRAYADDGYITAVADDVYVGSSTVGITADTDVASEAGQQPAMFGRRLQRRRRTGTIPFDLGGTLETSAYVVTDGDGKILDGSVTLPAGSDSQEILVYPQLEDHTPRWTETVDIDLTTGDGYTVEPTASAAGCYVTNHDDLYAWLDNGSDNDVFEGGSPSDGGTLVLTRQFRKCSIL